MHLSLLDVLACPSCGEAYEASSHRQSGQHLLQGYLSCSSCAVVVPVLEGFVFFTEPLLHAGLASPEHLQALAHKFFGIATEFWSYARQRRQRGALEPYAAFQPFNESSRAVEPLLPHAAAHLQSGDFILDTWCRTGWSGAWLAGLFPQQRVVSLWEGNSSVLGYKGFRHLLSSERADNLNVIFTHPEKPLPFRRDAFALLHGLDSLHRYGLYPFAGECLRVTCDDGALLFPHLHLSNSEPEPFFQRGCQQWHGRDYRAWLDRVTQGSGRRGYVFSEITLFTGPAIAELCDESDTTHYNGAVAILPAASVPQPLPAPASNSRHILSPLFRLHPGRRSARVSSALFDGAVGHLLERHPAYEARLPTGPVNLDDATWLMLLLVSVGYTTAALKTALPRVDVEAGLATLRRQELIYTAPVLATAHRLQRFHANQLPVRDAGIVEEFWRVLGSHTGSSLVLADGEALSGADLLQVCHGFAAALAARVPAPGSRVAVSATQHPLLLLAGLVAAAQGHRVRFLVRGDEPCSGAALWLCADEEPNRSAVATMPLGLDGAAGSLLASLDADGSPALSLWCDAGVIELPVAGAWAACPLADLIDACESLQQQWERQLWVLDGQGGLASVLACLCAWSCGEQIQALA